MDKSDYSVVFSNDFRFEEAEKFFKQKLPITKEQFDKLKQEYKDKAFTVSGYSNANIVDQFYKELLNAIKDGTTVTDFRKNINTFLDIKGYSDISKYQADNIFRTNWYPIK